MHIISTKVHGILDYAMGIVLILFPYLLPFSLEGMAHYFPMILGSATVLYSLCTAYEFGVMDLIPMRTHLVLDVLCAIFLIASPWVSFRRLAHSSSHSKAPLMYSSTSSPSSCRLFG